METVKTTVFASLSKEYMWDEGDKLGLSEKAKDFLKYFNEVPLIITINKETGEVIKTELK